MEEITKKQLEGLRGTANGEALMIYLEEEIIKMKDIHSIKTIEDLKARQEAEKILNNLFRFLEQKSNKPRKTNYK